jgi:hypothetical protein
LNNDLDQSCDVNPGPTKLVPVYGIQHSQNKINVFQTFLLPEIEICYQYQQQIALQRLSKLGNDKDQLRSLAVSMM